MPGLVAVLCRRLHLPADSSVGNDDVDATKIASDGLHRRTDLSGVGDIDDGRTRGLPVLLQLGDCRRQRIGREVPQAYRRT